MKKIEELKKDCEKMEVTEKKHQKRCYE